MNKLICFVLCAALLMALLVGCVPAEQESSGTTAPTTTPTQGNQPTEPTQGTEPTDPNQGTEPAERQQIAFSYQRFDGWYTNELSWESITPYVFRSLEELEVYRQENAESLETIDFEDAVSHYYESFFFSQTLLLIPVISGTCSSEYTVNRVALLEDGSYKVYIEDLYDDDAAASDAIGLWYILVEVEDKIPEGAQVTAVWMDSRIHSIAYEYQVIRSALDSRDPELDVISSRAELDAYCQQYAALLENSSFVDDVTMYDDAFFAEHTLLVISLSWGTSTVDQEVQYLVQRSDGSYSLHLAIVYYQEIVNTEVGQWRIVIEADAIIEEDADICIQLNDIWREE